MPRQEYPFIRYEYDDGTVDEHGHTCLPIKITNPKAGTSAITWGLVDTGADSSLFPATLAQDLGHTLKGEGVKSSVTSGIEQTNVPTYKHTFRMDLLSWDLKKTVWSAGKIEIDCAESNPPVLIGVEDFLRKFRITIDYPKEKIILQW